MRFLRGGLKLLPLIGAGAALIGGLGGAAMQADAVREAAAKDRMMAMLGMFGNMAMHNSSNAFNERLMREAWGREDNAIQRRVADLKAAGLSPVLAAGSAAQSSGPIQVRAADVSGGFHGNKMQAAQMAMANMANVAQTLTGVIGAFQQLRLGSAKATQEEAKAALAEGYAASELEEIRQRTSSARTREGIDAEELKYIQKKGHRIPGETSIVTQLMDVLKTLNDPEAEGLINKTMNRMLFNEKKEHVPLKKHSAPGTKEWMNEK